MKNVIHYVDAGNALGNTQIMVNGVRLLVPCFGRWAEIKIEVTTATDRYGRTTHIVGRIKPTRDGELSPLLASKSEDVFVAVPEQSRNRIIQQTINIPPGAILFKTHILETSYLAGCGEDAGRFVASAFLREYESLFEFIRTEIARQIPANILPYVCAKYSKPTLDGIYEAFGNINWRLLLMRSECDERTAEVIDFTMRNNRLRIHRLSNPKPVDIHRFNEPNREWRGYTNHAVDERIHAEAVARQAAYELNREQAVKEQSEAAIKATDMMHDLLGPEIHQAFVDTGAVTVEKDGYKFTIRPQQFISCQDPNGKRAELCIHTAGLSCHPIDEVVLAVLNIRHEFEDFMNTAHYFRDHGFQRPQFQKAV